MKTHRYYLILWLIAVMPLGFTACSDDDEPEEPVTKPFFEIEKAGYSISAEAQTIEVRIHTNIKVNVSIEYSEEDKGWVNVGKVEEPGEYLIYELNVKENTKSSQRMGYMVFTPTAGTIIPIDTKISGRTIVITQAGIEP